MTVQNLKLCLFVFVLGIQVSLFSGCNSKKDLANEVSEEISLSTNEVQTFGMRLTSGNAVRPYEQIIGGQGGSPIVFQKTDATAATTDKLAEYLLHQKKAQDEYFQKYKGDLELISKIRASLRDDLCFRFSHYSVCGPAILDSLTILLDLKPNHLILHYWIRALNPIKNEVKPGALEGLKYYVYWRGFISYFSNESKCSEAWMKLENEGESLENWPLNVCNLLLAFRTELRTAKSGRSSF